MNTQLCRMLGIEFPLLAFSHCPDVVAEVSRSEGFGAAGRTPDPTFVPDPSVGHA